MSIKVNKQNHSWWFTCSINILLLNICDKLSELVLMIIDKDLPWIKKLVFAVGPVLAKESITSPKNSHKIVTIYMR